MPQGVLNIHYVLGTVLVWRSNGTWVSCVTAIMGLRAKLSGNQTVFMYYCSKDKLMGKVSTQTEENQDVREDMKFKLKTEEWIRFSQIKG